MKTSLIPLTLLPLVFVVASCSVIRPTTTRLLGAARTNAVELDPGTVTAPHEPRVSALGPTGERLIDEWAAREIPDWKTDGKVTGPRVLLAKLRRGVDVDIVNDYLLAATPWSGVGSTWGLRSRGDYDFSLPPLTAILYEYGDRPDILRTEVRDHLLSVLLNQDGPRFTTTVPGSLRLVTETENHILMIDGSRYLKNQWLRAHGNEDPRYDNVANGLQAKLVAFITETELAGPYEFNSTPYLGYTVSALLTLEAFGAAPVATAARNLLDRINYEFAIGSLDLRRYPVYRRQPERAGRTGLTDNPHTALMAVWVSGRTDVDYEISENEHQALYAALMPYRLPVDTARLATSIDRDYFVRIGRGPGASPEIYTGGPDFLISSGGTGRPPLTLIVARPIALFLNDDANDLSQLFRIGGGGDYHKWNNTGVLPGFAVAKSPAQIPADSTYIPIAQGSTWSVYVSAAIVGNADAASDRADAPRVLIAVADTGATAALFVQPFAPATVPPVPDETDAPATDGPDVVIPDGLTAALYDQALALAADLDRLAPGDLLDDGLARLPDNREVRFDLDAGPDLWVIISIDGDPVDRDVTRWPRLATRWTTLLK